MTINEACQLEEVYVHAEGTEIMYPESMISPTEAKHILQERQGHIRFVGAENGDIYWVETGW